MARHEATIIPGGMNTDKKETALGAVEHQLVINLRQEKIGEWSSVPGYKNVLDIRSEGVNIKSAIEVTDDLSGDRFILYQDGTELKRVDYDIINSPEFGYENETPETLTLPSGVSIDSEAKCRFFLHNGVVRITGPSEPLWYGYIKNTLFPITTEDDFENDNSWHWWIGSAKCSKELTSRYAKSGEKSMKVSQTSVSSAGMVCRHFDTIKGQQITVSIWFYKPSAAGSADVVLRCGESEFGSEYGAKSSSVKDEWTKLEMTVDIDSNDFYVSLDPGAGSNKDYAFFDDFSIKDESGIAISPEIKQDQWVLERAGLYPLSLEMDEYEQFLIIEDNPGFEFGRSFSIYDGSQYSLLKILNKFEDFYLRSQEYSPSYIGAMDYTIGHARYLLRIPGSNLRDNWTNKRITEIGFAVSRMTQIGVIDETKLDWKINNIIDLTKELPVIIYSREKSYYDPTYPKRIILSHDYAGNGDDVIPQDNWLYEGAPIILRKGPYVLHSKITNVDFLYKYFEISDNIYQAGGKGLISYNHAQYIEPLTIAIKPKWFYDSFRGYSTYFVVDNSALSLGFWEQSNIPEGTIENTPNYKHWAIVEDIAYVNSEEDEEEDSIRYSPIYQPDNFPVLNIFQTDVGNIDKIKAMTLRDNRIVIMKSDTVAQGNFVNSRWYKDTEPKGTGLFPEDGFLVIGKILFFMDKEDIYLFEGVQPYPLMITQQLKNYYKTYRDEYSFILENKLDNEVWFILGNTILVYNSDRKEWYVRSTNINLRGGFIDADRKLIAFNGNKFVTYNHSNSTFDENITWKALFRIFTEKYAQFYKKLHDIVIHSQSNRGIKITWVDKHTGSSGYEIITPTETEFTTPISRPKFFYKQLELTIENEGSYSNTQTKIRDIKIRTDIPDVKNA